MNDVKGQSGSVVSATPLHSQQAHRWLHVVTHLDAKYGGLSATVPRLSMEVASLQEREIELAAFYGADEEHTLASKPGFRLSQWPTSRAAWLKQSKLRQHFNKLVAKCEGVHIHGLWEQSTLTAARCAQAKRVPYVISAHGMLEPWALRNRRVKKAIYSAILERNNVCRASCLHALTQSEAQDYRRYGAEQPIVVIPNGVSIPPDLSPRSFLAAYPNLEGKRIVVYLGRLHIKKGLDLLVEAWKVIANSFPDAHLVLAGPDFENTRSHLEATIGKQHLGHRVTFTGMLGGEMKWSLLAASECFVLPSRSEGLSVSTLEAMGAGLPVIITDHCHLPEVSEHSAGWVVSLKVEELQSALIASMQNTESDNAIIGSRGRDLVEDQFAWTRVARKMNEVYRWIEGGPLPSTVEILHLGGLR